MFRILRAEIEAALWVLAFASVLLAVLLAVVVGLVHPHHGPAVAPCPSVQACSLPPARSAP